MGFIWMYNNVQDRDLPIESEGLGFVRQGVLSMPPWTNENT